MLLTRLSLENFCEEEQCVINRQMQSIFKVFIKVGNVDVNGCFKFSALKLLLCHFLMFLSCMYGRVRKEEGK